VLDQGIDTTTPGGRLLFHVLASMSEFVGDLITEKTREGLTAARARGRVAGRPLALGLRRFFNADRARRDTKATSFGT